MRIFLAARNKLSQKVAEHVEADMPVGHVMQLLESRALAESFAGNASIYVKRQDGSTIPLKVDPMIGLSGLEHQVGEMEGVIPTALTFVQAQDGNLHVVVWHSAESSKDTYPVYQRNIKPQPIMLVSIKWGVLD